ncbi:uncharacterized protein B0H18DRAFT_951821 [Fomitopsis serialis]|uniref:uncharacterized protein n=1 Tax=Fomitopsis serialis TaxID=139415 RepID=UPI002007FDAF|nr:uncharacterized protein B0H18DRAFT_951821 [Neoantrodia serialis]KAH9933859.1 hypothetical protein B0H18DRAFT_951821 [Neoantrodia serialis]
MWVPVNLFKMKSHCHLKEIEVYSRKYYDEQVKPLVQKQLHGRTVTKAKRLLIIKDTTEDKYKTEDENIKEEIRVHVLALRTLGANSDEEDEAKEGADEDMIDLVVCQVFFATLLQRPPIANFLNGQETHHIWQFSMSASKTPLIPVELSIFSKIPNLDTPMSIQGASHGEGIFWDFTAFNGALVLKELS